MKAAGYSENLVPIYQTAWCNILKHTSVQLLNFYLLTFSHGMT